MNQIKMSYLLYSDPQVNLLKLNVEDSISFLLSNPPLNPMALQLPCLFLYNLIPEKQVLSQAWPVIMLGHPDKS